MTGMRHPIHGSPFPVPPGPDVPLLQEGLTCWSRARAERFAIAVDAASYFAALRDALLRARHSVLFIGWEFDTRIRLDPDRSEPGVPDRLGPFLSHLAETRPGLRIHVLQWRLGLVGALVRGTTPLYLLNWLSKRRFRLHLDGSYPHGASHHQKVVVIDDAVAFCGGIDITADRWDTPEHRDGDPRRRRPSGRPYGPFHDVTAAVDGAAARALGDLARERWRRATGEVLEPPPSPPDGAHDPWPDRLEPWLRGVDVAIARTEPAHEGRPEVREVEALWLAAIASARRTIYVESQYFASRCIGEALAARLSEPDGPEVVVINPREADGWLAGQVMDGARQRMLEHVRRADLFDRFRILTPVTPAGTPIYVHAKVLAVDDRLLRIGSANLNNRSMGLDTECDLAVEAVVGEPGEAGIRQAVLSFRNALLAEHLGVGPEVVQASLGRHGGSLVRALDVLRRPTGRTLLRLEAPAAGVGASLAESELLDPERAEPVWTALRHAVEDWIRRTGSRGRR